MRRNTISIVWILKSVMLFLAAASMSGCVSEKLSEWDQSYGYVQFKLYKDASYADSKAVSSQLDYLSAAKKVRVTMQYGEQTITQTVTLTSVQDAEEFGLRSDKVKLLSGDYDVVTFTLFNGTDEEIYYDSFSRGSFSIVPGGLTQCDLTVNVLARGYLKFNFKKDLSGFDEIPGTKSERPKQYVLEQVAYVNVTIENQDDNTSTVFEEIPVEYSISIDEDKSGNGVYQTSELVCDTLFCVPAGNYKVSSYSTFSESKILLETHDDNDQDFLAEDFVISDNRIVEADVNLTLYEADEYIKDNYALYEIWKALDGKNWYYVGESYNIGANWDFNKDPDLWSYQPGVEVHENGRVAKIVISEFGFKGAMPEALGQLTELVELYLGTHSDKNHSFDDPVTSSSRKAGEKSLTRMEDHKKYLDLVHPATQMSPACALALREHNLDSPAISSYRDCSNDDLAAMAAGVKAIPSSLEIMPMDVNQGTLCNGLTSLPESIGNLTKLEYLFIANSEISSLPQSIKDLESCTDVEIYNCPNLKEFPEQIAQMPNLVSLNMSCNPQWGAENTRNAFEALATGPSKEKIQIIYSTHNSLESIPESLSDMLKLSLLDLTSNNLKGKLPAFGTSFAPVDLILDNNSIEGFEPGVFCKIDDLETFSMRNNLLTEFPNIFSSDSDYVISSIDLSLNKITGLPDDFNGVLVTTLTLAGNPIKVFPKGFAETNSMVAYFVMNGCGLEEIPEGCFSGEKSSSSISFDFTYNKLKKFPEDFIAESLPYLYGLDVSYNSFDAFPFEPLDCSGLTIFAIRGQRDASGDRCLREWPTGIYKHTGLRGFFIGSNDLRKIDDTISYLIYNLDISDNPNITFDASDVCAYWKAGAYMLIYDKTQNIINCDEMLE